jgi:glycosyltransferase involved in cell wall biosynthesis
VRVAVLASAQTVGGAEKPLLEFAREALLASSPRLDLRFLAFVRNASSSPFTEALEAENIPIDIIKERHRYDIRVIQQLRDGIRRHNPQVVLTNGVKSHFLFRVACSNLRLKWVAYHHGYTNTNWLNRAYNQLDRWSLRAADRLITVCKAHADDISGRGVPRNKICIQHTPLRASVPVAPETAQRLKRELGLTENTRVILSIGRLSREKGHADLLRPYDLMQKTALYPVSLNLIVIGDGPELGRLKALAHQLGISHLVQFLGYREAARQYYAIADVFVLPSHSEGSPNVLLEAIEARVPIVSAAVGGVPEMVTNEHHALPTERNDIAGLAKAITRVLNDPQLCTQLTTAAYNVLDSYTPPRYFRTVAAVCQELVES